MTLRHLLTFISILALSAGALADPPHWKRTRSEKIMDQVYSDRAKQFQRSRSQWRSTHGDAGRPGGTRQGGSSAANSAAVCGGLRAMARGGSVNLSRLQDLILPNPPSVRLSFWNGYTIDARIRWWGKACPLTAQQVQTLLRRGKSSGSRGRSAARARVRASFARLNAEIAEQQRRHRAALARIRAMQASRKERIRRERLEKEAHRRRLARLQERMTGSKGGMPSATALKRDVGPRQLYDLPQALPRSSREQGRAVAACRRGRKAACLRAGAYLLRGGRPEQLARARKLFARACRRGHGPSCNNLASMLTTGTGGPVDHDRARALYDKACDKANHGQACVSSALMLRQGRGGPVDEKKARGRLWWACGFKPRSIEACLIEGEHAATRGEYVTAVNHYDIACRRGKSPEGCFGHGYALFKRGNAERTDQRRKDMFWGLAYESFTEGCKLGSAEACVMAGAQSFMGKGVAKNQVAARRFYTRACELGLAKGCRILAFTWRDGQGGPRSQEKAKELLARACALGDQAACR